MIASAGERSSGKQADLLREYEAVLSYEAPFLIEKLLKERIVGTQEEGEALFAEVKKYLVMCTAAPDVLWNVYSARVDKVWHEFVLFTREYAGFCQRLFGRYLHHSPSNAPKPEGETSGDHRESTFPLFQSKYESLFGMPLPDSWFDELNVTLSSRVIYDGAGRSNVLVEEGVAKLMYADGEVQLSVNDLASDALQFICQNGAFYVRELPGDLADDEKTGLVSTLVEHRLLRVAP